MSKLKKFARILPLLSSLGLAGCIGSLLNNLIIGSVHLTPANPTIAVGATQAFVLSANLLDGVTDREPASDVTWSSDNAAVATIAKTGVATAVAVGTAHIAGNFHGNNATTLLTVTAAANVATAMAGDSRSLRVTNLRTGQEMSFAADGLRDAIMISRGGAARSIAGDTANVAGASADGSETSVLPEHGPAWIAVDSAGRYIYVVNRTSESVSAFAIDWKDGTLEAVRFSPFSAGTKPWTVEVDPGGSSVSVTHLQSSEVSRFRIDPATGALKPFGEN
jgi:DNA-binding beta-propeller fold protein YncE